MMTHEKLYNPYKVYFLDITVLNLYVSLLDAERLRRNRRLDEVSYPETNKVRSTFAKWKKHNNHSWKNFLIPLITFICLLMFTFKAIIYLSFPQDRDPKTMEYLDPTLKFFQSIYLTDILYKFKGSENLHRLSLILFLNQIMTIVYAIRQQFEDARCNYDRYRKINILQVDVESSSSYAGTLRDWYNFMVFGLTHKCDLRSPEAREYFEASKRLSASVKDSDRIERLIFFNQIDFSHCFKGTNIRIVNEEEAKCPNSLFGPRKAFNPTPPWRLDPTQLTVALILGFFGGIVLIVFTLIAIFSLVFSLLEPTEYYDRPIDFWINMFGNLFKFRNFMLVLESIMICICTSNNVLHVSIFAYANVSLYSRIARVRNLFEVERGIHREYQKWLARSIDIEIGENGCSINQDVYEKQIESVKSKFLQRADDRSIENMNENLRFLLNLIEVLKFELNDMRSFFTVYMNLYICFGTIGFALAPNVLTTSQASKEWFLMLSMYVATLVPISAVLIFAATIDSSVSTSDISDDIKE